jgi:DNA-3-methyladenine glycosylase
MFGPPGHVYVYLIYGMYNCFNVVTDAEGTSGAILVRALEPGEGVEQRTDGPGRLCRALEIDRSHNGFDLAVGPIWIERRSGSAVEEVATSPRIGVDYAGEWAARPWRFYDASSRWVSGRPVSKREAPSP